MKEKKLEVLDKLNRKHEMFLNIRHSYATRLFEMLNRKHEMFLNIKLSSQISVLVDLNRKHEMFLNNLETNSILYEAPLTVNMKCF